MNSLNEQWFTEKWVGQGAALSLQMGEGAKIYGKRSGFQLIEVFQTKSFGRLLTLDGLVMLTERDNFIYHEMLSHVPIYAHKAPRDILIVGGGDCGTLREVLKHPEILNVDLVEIDEEVTRTSEKYFPDLCVSNKDPRARFHFVDGVEWVKTSDHCKYDIVIVDGSDPVGPASVLFSDEFFQGCYSALKQGGVFCGQSESPLFHLELIQHVHNALLRSGFDDVKTAHFPQCVYPSGWWSTTLASKGGTVDVIRDEAVSRTFKTTYYNVDVHRAALAQPQFMVEALG